MPHLAVVIACEPLKLVPLMLLAVCNVVAVNAFPVQDPDEPDTFPVTLPVTLPTTLPFKSPVKPLTKRAAPLTIRSSVVIESALVEPCKDFSASYCLCIVSCNKICRYSTYIISGN